MSVDAEDAAIELLVIVAGPSGSGKSTLIDQLTAANSPHNSAGDWVSLLAESSPHAAQYSVARLLAAGGSSGPELRAARPLVIVHLDILHEHFVDDGFSEIGLLGARARRTVVNDVTATPAELSRCYRERRRRTFRLMVLGRPSLRIQRKQRLRRLNGRLRDADRHTYADAPLARYDELVRRLTPDERYEKARNGPLVAVTRDVT